MTELFLYVCVGAASFFALMSLCVCFWCVSKAKDVLQILRGRELELRESLSLEQIFREFLIINQNSSAHFDVFSREWCAIARSLSLDPLKLRPSDTLSALALVEKGFLTPDGIFLRINTLLVEERKLKLTSFPRTLGDVVVLLMEK